VQQTEVNARRARRTLMSRAARACAYAQRGRCASIIHAIIFAILMLLMLLSTPMLFAD